MRTTVPPTLRRRSSNSFETLNPGALADWLMTAHGFTEQILMAGETYRLHTESMIVSIFAYGLILCEGRNAATGALLLTDLTQEGGQAA